MEGILLHITIAKPLLKCNFGFMNLQLSMSDPRLGADLNKTNCINAINTKRFHTSINATNMKKYIRSFIYLFMTHRQSGETQK